MQTPAWEKKKKEGRGREQRKESERVKDRQSKGEKERERETGSLLGTLAGGAYSGVHGVTEDFRCHFSGRDRTQPRRIQGNEKCVPSEHMHSYFILPGQTRKRQFGKFYPEYTSSL